MRDPDLVHRAERAATGLEEAWTRWRVRHGLGSGPLPPVSSYVGYSVDEPWGQPRVVFGIEAGEAEQLAAILDAQDYAGPVHAEVSAQAARRQPETAPAAWTVPARSPAVPPQEARLPATARAVASGRSTPARPSTSARPSVLERPSAPTSERPAVTTEQPPAPDAEAGAPGAGQFAAAGLAVPAGRERPVADGAARAEAGAPGAGQFAAAPPVSSEYADVAAEELTAEQPILPRALHQAAAVADEPAELPADEVAYLQELAARSSPRPGIVALRPRSAGPPESRPQSAPLPQSGPGPWHAAADAGQAAASAGRPAKDAGQPGPDAGQTASDAVQSGPAPGQAATDPGTATAEASRPPGEDAPVRSDVQMARLLPVARLNRSRAPAEAGPWPAPNRSRQTPTDTAV